MNIQRKNSAHHFRMQSEREQTLVRYFINNKYLPRCFEVTVHNTKYCFCWTLTTEGILVLAACS